MLQPGLSAGRASSHNIRRYLVLDHLLPADTGAFLFGIGLCSGECPLSKQPFGEVRSLPLRLDLLRPTPLSLSTLGRDLDHQPSQWITKRSRINGAMWRTAMASDSAGIPSQARAWFVFGFEGNPLFLLPTSHQPLNMDTGSFSAGCPHRCYLHPSQREARYPDPSI